MVQRTVWRVDVEGNFEVAAKLVKFRVRPDTVAVVCFGRVAEVDDRLLEALALLGRHPSLGSGESDSHLGATFSKSNQHYGQCRCDVNSHSIL
jgi:hypothetical protein